MERNKTLKKQLLMAAKIGIGSSLAIFIAKQLHLDNAVSAGTITLLTLLGTKWDTVKLSVFRLITFGISIVISCFLSMYIHNTTIAFGIFVFLTVLVAEILGWRTTISVNAVAGAHLFISGDFSPTNIYNEFLLVMIGILLAIILNLFHDNENHKLSMVADMRKTEIDLRDILKDIAAYLRQPTDSSDVWTKIKNLESRLQKYIRDAYEYQDNTFSSHPVYYIDYFEMRYDQVQVLHSLHYSMQQISTVPRQANLIADYILYLTDYVVEKHHPEQQEERLHRILEGMKKDDLPKTREEFESRALLFHILMDLESFLKYKKQFVEKLDDKQMKRYWYKLG